MEQVILGNMWVCLVSSLPDPGTGLQLSGLGSTEWQAPDIKTYAIGQIGGINTGYTISLEICLGSGYNGFGEDW